MMKQHIRTLLYTGLISASLGLVSCEDYLDRDVESTVSSEDAFNTFEHFQGFTEELYYCLPDQAHCYWQTSFNWGEDEIISFGKDYFMGYKVDLGDFWGWQAAFDGWGCGWMDGNNVSSTSTDRMQKRFGRLLGTASAKRISVWPISINWLTQLPNSATLSPDSFISSGDGSTL